jgi:hypothetical protein
MSRLFNKLTFLEKKNREPETRLRLAIFFHMRKIRVATDQSTQIEIRYFFPKPLQTGCKAVRVTVVKAC